MIAGALVMAVGTIPAFVESLPMLILSRLVVGAGEAAMMAAAVLWLLRLAGPERRGRAMGHIGLANYAGLTIGPPLSQALSGQAHPTRVWVTAAVLPLIAAAFAAVLGRSPDRHVAPEATPDTDEQQDEAATPSTLRATLRPGLGLMLVNFGYVAVLSFGAAAATEQGTGIASLVIPVFGVGVIASRTILAGVPDRFGAPRTLIVAVTIEAAGLAGMAATTSTPVALFALVVMAIGQGLAVPSLGLLALPRCRRAGTAGRPAHSLPTSTRVSDSVVRRWGLRRAPPTRPAGCSRRPAPCSRLRPSRCSPAGRPTHAERAAAPARSSRAGRGGSFPSSSALAPPGRKRWGTNSALVGYRRGTGRALGRGVWRANALT